MSRLPFDEQWTVARWRFGWLTVKFADGCRGVFSSWNAALFAIEHERLRVRWSGASTRSATVVSRDR